MPDPGDALQVSNHTITVLSTEGTRIKQLAIIRHGPDEAEDQAEAEVEE